MGMFRGKSLQLRLGYITEMATKLGLKHKGPGKSRDQGHVSVMLGEFSSH